MSAYLIINDEYPDSRHELVVEDGKVISSNTMPVAAVAEFEAMDGQVFRAAADAPGFRVDLSNPALGAAAMEMVAIRFGLPIGGWVACDTAMNRLPLEIPEDAFVITDVDREIAELREFAATLKEGSVDDEQLRAPTDD